MDLPGTIRHWPRDTELLPVNRDHGLARRIQHTAACSHFNANRGDVGRLDVDATVAYNLRIQVRALPMLAERIHNEPLHPVVGQRPRAELELARISIAPTRGNSIEDAINLDFGIGMIAVPGLWPDDACELQAFRRHRLFHHIGGLL